MKLRIPMFVVAGALLALMVVLATLQYRWLGQISADERDRRGASLAAQATALADDFDRELTRAYLLFQWEPTPDIDNLAARVAGRWERWQATAAHPNLVREVFVVRADHPDTQQLQRFNPAGRLLEPVAWPDALAELRVLSEHRLPEPSAGGTALVRALPRPLWGNIPALVVPLPVVMFHPRPESSELRLASAMSYAVLLLDRELIVGELLPALAERHFGTAPDGDDYQLAIVEADGGEVVYRSTAGFDPARGAEPDAAREIFQVRPQEFGGMVSEIRRISTIVAAPLAPPGAQVFVQERTTGTPAQPRTQARIEFREGAAMSVLLQPGTSPQERAAVVTGTASFLATRAFTGSAQWRLVVRHRSGSLEAAVDAARRRNVAISSGILGLLGVSVGFLVLSTRRAQQLARQQMEFVAAVSHELRTPLSVIRSAGDNLAEGVVGDEARVRRYGDLVRNEGRRLTEMVEQILEFAGIHSGQRTFVLRPVPVRQVVAAVVEASRTLAEDAGLSLDVDISDHVPPVLADEAAFRRVVQNLVGNAIKYGKGGTAVRISASAAGREVRLAVADRGMGIPVAEQARIFEPFYRVPEVVAAQIQGAGLGLSLVKRIVESHGGRISVRSAPGQGSEFTVHLPAASGEPVARAAEAPAVPGAAGHGSHA
jgi:two-component system, OmpR family, sensor histidine kinase SenX3